MISYIGMQTQEVAIKPSVKVTMRSNAEALDEVVVVAYGTAKKESLTGSISVVDNKKIEKRITTSVTGALEGAAPGVQVNNTYGEPGSAPSIRIRGFGTLVSGASDPLYVVDGVPFDGNMAELNSNDIESMSILKDAASAALYGNRAANGVVIITTKSGRNTHKPSITLQMNQGMYNRGIPEYDRLDADRWMEATWMAKKNAMMSNAGMSASDAAAYATGHVVSESIGRNIYNAAGDKLFDNNGKLIATRLAGYDDLDWQNAIERTGHRQEYNLSAATSGEKYNVYSSIGYLNEKGYVKATGYERFSGRINTTYTPNKWFKGGVNLTGSWTKRDYNSNASGNYYANPFYITRYMAPVYPLFMHNADGTYQLDADGNKIYDTTSSYLSNRNIAYEMLYNKQESVRNVLGGQAFATISLPYGLSLTVKGDLNNSTSNNKKYDNPEIGDGATNGGRLTSYAYQYKTVTLQEILSWNYQFNQVHNVEAMVAHENYSWERKYTSGMNTGMAVDGNLTMGNFLNNSYFSGSDDEDKTESYLARVKYNYDNRYFVEGSFRRDGSSRFHKDNRWGNFYSVGVSWNMKQEAFLQDVDWVDALKLRASYGEVGNNMGVSLYGHMALYTIDKNGGEAALVKQSLSAPDIKWETTQTVDVAVEGRLFNRLNFQIGYWKIQCKLPPKTKRFCPLKTFNNAPLKSLDRWGYYYFSLFPSVCSHFTDTFSCQLNPVRRMYNTIHNGICYCRVSDCIIPIVRWQLRGDDDGLAPMSVLYYIEQDGSFLGIKVHKEEVIQYEQRAPFDSLEFRFQCAFYFCHLKRTHKFRSIRIICPYALLAGFIPHCCGKEALPGTG